MSNPNQSKPGSSHVPGSLGTRESESGLWWIAFNDGSVAILRGPTLQEALLRRIALKLNLKLEGTVWEVPAELADEYKPFEDRLLTEAEARTQLDALTLAEFAGTKETR
jgi:hypothetical protein